MADILQTQMPALPTTQGLFKSSTATKPEYITAEKMAPAMEESRQARTGLLQQIDETASEQQKLETKRNVGREEEKLRLREEETRLVQESPERLALKTARDELKNAAFVPKKDTAKDIATLFSLTSIVGMAIGGDGKASAFNTMAAMNGMIEGYQKGRTDLYKREKDVFEKNLKLLQGKVTLLQSELQEAMQTYKTNRELGEQKAEIAFAKAGSDIGAQKLKQQGLVRAVEYIDGVAKDTSALVNMANDQVKRSEDLSFKEREQKERERANRAQESFKAQEIKLRKDELDRKQAQQGLPNPRASAINERYANTVYRSANEVLRSMELVEQIGITRGGGVFAGVVGKGTIPTQLQGQLGQYFTSEQEKNYNTAMSGIALEMAYVLNGGYKPDGQTVNKIEGLLAVTPNDTVGNAAYKFSDVAAKLKAGIEYTPTYTELQKKAKEEMMRKLDRYATPEVVYERQYGVKPKPDPRVRTTPGGATVSNWE
jgi:chemotaxis protein histidine kinase CheA